MSNRQSHNHHRNRWLLFGLVVGVIIIAGGSIDSRASIGRTAGGVSS